MKRLFATIFCIILAFLAFAQSDTVRISGRVVDVEGMPVEACIVTVLQPTDSVIVAYSMTDENGRYSTAFVRKTSEVLVRLTGFNVKKTLQKVGANSQTIDLRAEEESIALREVQIRAQRLWGSRDTLNYLVASYIRDQDRTIGDVLKQLPGITIDGGVIKYQGTPINHFYIENMDVLQGRYSIATKGIRAEDVATVQVLENHEHIKALQDQVPPESAAINLKLKEKAKGVWTKSADLGLGWDDALLWDTSVNLMYFGKGQQHVFFYGNENTGATADVAPHFYGGSGMSATVLTSILAPGSSPVGKTLRNNRNSANMSNLTKVSETAQIHYNLNYAHDIQRRNAFSQTTYILPEGDVRIMAEDISARQTTNDAAVQLIYEDNTKLKFLNNKLELVGHWTEANGKVRSNDEGIGQHAFNRNLGLQNSTHWVHRTANGGGFDLHSTNSVQTTPQALSVWGGMDARQEVDMTRISSTNSFSLVKDLRRKRWTIVPTSSLNINYVGLESMLRHTTNECGTMDYLNASASLGASLKYVKNEFRMTLNLPLSLAYTNVFHETDATRLRISPSFNLLWKAAQNWTLSGGANYGMSQTPWTQLITTYVMSNYRTMSRYAASLNDSHSAAVEAKVNYKDIFNEFFAYVQGSVGRSWCDIIYGTTIDENAHAFIQAEQMPNHSNTYSLTGNISKGFDWHATKIEATANYRRNESQTLRQSVKSDYHSDTYNISGNVAANIVKQVRLDYNGTWSLTQAASSTYSQSIRCFSQSASLNVSVIPNKFLLQISGRHTHNSGMQDKKDYAFADASLTMRTKKKHEVVLSLDNIFNTRTFVSRSNTDLTEYFTMYNLRPRSIMVKMRF